VVYFRLSGFLSSRTFGLKRKLCRRNRQMRSMTNAAQRRLSKELLVDGSLRRCQADFGGSTPFSETALSLGRAQ
jgi:hypothetical protein